MTIEVPPLDTIAFEELVAEARALIPRYAPEWTDHNVHDPGITLLELLAWITDQQIYQVGFVGPPHHAAFARLLGVEPRRARPALGVIWPSSPVAIERQLDRDVIIRADEEPALHFALDREVRLSAARLLAIEGFDNRGGRELLASESQAGAAFSIEGQSEIRLSFDRPIASDPVGGEPMAVVTVGIEINNPVVGAPHDAGKLPRWGPLRFWYQVGSAAWQPVSILWDDTATLLRSGTVGLNLPIVRSGPEGRPRSQLRLCLDEAFFPNGPWITRFRHNALPVEQLERKSEIVVGTSDGLPNQAFDVAEPSTVRSGQTLKRYLPDPSTTCDRMEIEVATSSGWEAWAEVDGFGKSKPNEQVFHLDAVSFTIRFGNGVNGRIPAQGAVIRCRPYQVTNGRTGNVRANLHWRVPGTSLVGPGSWKNTTHFEGGADPWDERQLHVETRRRSRRRNVHLRDEELRRFLVSLPGFCIAHAAVHPRANPHLPGRAIPNHRTAVVVPDFLRLEPHPKADWYQRTLDRRVDRYRPLGERLLVRVGEPVPVKVRARLLVEPTADHDTIEEGARQQLGRYLPAPNQATGRVVGGFQPVLGQNVRIGKVKAILARVDGVVAVVLRNRKE